MGILGLIESKIFKVEFTLFFQYKSGFSSASPTALRPAKCATTSGLKEETAFFKSFFFLIYQVQGI